MDKLERSIDEMVVEYKEAGIDKMVLLGWDAETATGLPRLPGPASENCPICSGPCQALGDAS